MAPRKGFGPFTRVISADLSDEKNWYVLSHRICAMSPLRYFKKNAVVLAYPEEFAQVEMKSLRLVEGISGNILWTDIIISLPGSHC